MTPRGIRAISPAVLPDRDWWRCRKCSTRNPRTFIRCVLCREKP